MSAARRKSPEARRSELVNAALALFVTKGVASTAVSDIVAAAGVAQGTFYLYFKSKDDLVNAVVEHITESAIGSIEQSLQRTDLGVVDKLGAMSQALVEMSDEPHEMELLRLFHRPENEAVHDRVARSMHKRVTPLLAEVLAQGISEGLFLESLDPMITASFVLGGMQTLESDFYSAEGFDSSVKALREFLLRGLGYVPD